MLNSSGLCAKYHKLSTLMRESMGIFLNSIIPIIGLRSLSLGGPWSAEPQLRLDSQVVCCSQLSGNGSSGICLGKPKGA